MTTKRLRILSLSNAFPPGVSGRFPAVNPSGHATETRMGQALGRVTEISSVGLLGGEVYGQLEPRDDSFGLAHELILWDRSPELWHRWQSWRRLRRHYLNLIAKQGPPDILLVRNLTPIFNHFVRWLRRQSPRPKIVLVFADSGTFGQTIKWSRRLRYQFKPMQVLDDEAIKWYDACISFGIGTRQFFEPRGVPWMWMPSASNFHYDPPPAAGNQSGPIRFGYFGALAEHAAVLQLVEGFLQAGVPGSLHMCGFGKLADQLREIAARQPNFKFDGLLPKQSDCLDWAQRVDVLVNPRLNIWGLENSFPSKIFEFGMTGKAILSTRTGGVDEVLRADGLYLETENFAQSLQQQLRAVAALDRTELARRGAAIRARLLKEFNWDHQAERMVEFLTGVLGQGR